LITTLNAALLAGLWVLFLLGASIASPLTQRSPAKRAGLTRFVDPFIGTAASNSPSPVPGGAGGSTIPGAMVPFGMVQLSPDTPHGSPSGYAYRDSILEDFSLTHFNGAGCPNKEDVRFLPMSGDLAASPGTHWSDYASPFDHRDESASPGFYAVRLRRDDIGVALTATSRSGFARFRFGTASKPARVLIDVSRNATGAREGSIQILGQDEIAGSVTGGGFCGGQTYPIYFVSRFDRPFSSFGTWSGDTLSKGSQNASGKLCGAWFEFEIGSNTVLQMKTALSYVSIENARANLDSESPGWDFEAVRGAARTAWDSILARVVVEGGSENDLEKFYTALYHVFSNPNVCSDVNGQYRGFDDAVHSARGYTNYQNWSGWDIYRSWIQLASVLAPETRDFAVSMLAAGQEGGLLPMWSDVHKEDNVMVGDPGAVIVASAFAFGVRGFDAAAALHLMQESGSNPRARMQGTVIRSGLEGWLRDHYYSGNAAVTLEYAQADFAVAQMARALGDSNASRAYLRRSANWKNNWNPESRFVHPRNDSGWLAPFDPARGAGFVEGNAAQYTWMVPFDMQGVIERLGGDAAAVVRLDSLFSQLNAGIDRPYFYIGNEPQFATPWAYAFAGAPWKTRDVVRRIVTESFETGPGGLPGNDDLGATSSWLVWAMLGMYPAIPGTDVLVLHGPLFPKSELELANGKRLVIRGANAGSKSRSVQQVKLNGVIWKKSWVRFTDLAAGGTLEFTMSDEHNRSWGSALAERPPSFAAEPDPAPPPVSEASRPRPPGRNVALGMPATADGACGPNEGPEKAVNGSVMGGNSDKWCSLGENKWLQVDLGSARGITGFVVQHAGAGWESTEWNTRDFDLQTSLDGRAWSTVVTVTGNTSSITSHPIELQQARYVRLVVKTPEGCCGTGAARIYELEVYAKE
jgi:predicted alpha-1,2-mannosidase